MSKNPSDLLEFLRKSRGEESPPPAPIRPAVEDRSERTVPMIVLRRSQVTVAAVAAGLALILVFLLGLGLGGGGEEPAAATPVGQRVWGIRVVSYKRLDDARVTQKLLQDLDLEEVTLQKIPSQGVIVVMVGSWLSNPGDNPRAKATLAKVQNLSTHGKNRAFPDAHFWSIQR